MSAFQIYILFLIQFGIGIICCLPTIFTCMYYLCMEEMEQEYFKSKGNFRQHKVGVLNSVNEETKQYYV